MPGSINITDPGGPGGGGGGTSDRRKFDWRRKKKDPELEEDTVKLGENDVAPPTLQTALSQLSLIDEVLDFSALKKLIATLAVSR
jgi:hypothetical protein